MNSEFCGAVEQLAARRTVDPLLQKGALLVRIQPAPPSSDVLSGSMGGIAQWMQSALLRSGEVGGSTPLELIKN